MFSIFWIVSTPLLVITASKASGLKSTEKSMVLLEALWLAAVSLDVNLSPVHEIQSFLPVWQVSPSSSSLHYPKLVHEIVTERTLKQVTGVVLSQVLSNKSATY